MIEVNEMSVVAGSGYDLIREENRSIKTIAVRIDDQLEPTGYITFPAVYAGNNKAVAVLNGGIEIHFVEPTSDEDVFTLQYSTEPLLDIEQRTTENALRDLSTLTLPELLSRYTFKGFQGLRI